MKQLIFLLSLTCIFAMNAGAQTAPVNRGVYGTQSNFFTTAMHQCNAAGTAKPNGNDTLTNGDTGYVYIWIGQGYSMGFDLATTTLTGTVASTSNILYGYNNNGKALTAAQVATVTTSAGTKARAITGNTTYCAGCVGASSTTVPGALLHYIWQAPDNAGVLFDNYIIRTIQTGTATATYSAGATTQK